MATPEKDPDLWRYNCEDCVRTREVGETEALAIASMGLQAVDDFQQRLFFPVLQAMIRGVRVDLAARKRMDDELEAEISKRVAYFNFVLGHSLNVNSPKQMMALFYEDFGLPKVMSKATKASPAHITCNEDALLKLAYKEPLFKPFIQAIMELRTLRVLLSTFVRMPLDYDQRMRCSYNICGTKTYRLNSGENAFGSGGNLQNITSGGAEEEFELILPNIRKMYVPDPGFIFWDTDLSKADLHIVVWESDEQEMKVMLAEGRDPYVEAARELHRDSSIQKKLPNGEANPKYTKFKSLAHGTNYLGTAPGLAARLGLLVHEVDRTQKWYFGKYPAIAAWQKRFAAEIIRTRKVQNKFGYIRQYFDRIDDGIIREAIAWLPQSTVACLINRVWVNLHDHEPDIQVLLQNHDSLAGQFPAHRQDYCTEAFRRHSQITIPYDQPLIIPIGLKTSEKSWGDCG